jgi:hypothetical protein
LVLRQLTLGLLQLHLEWPGIDLGKQISPVDEVPFAEDHPHQLPVDTRPDGDGVEGRDRPERRQADRDVCA